MIFDIEPGNQAVFAGEQILQQNLGQAKVSTGFAGFSARLAVGQVSAEKVGGNLVHQPLDLGVVVGPFFKRLTGTAWNW